MKVKVIEEKCISCGLCENIAPEVFTLEGGSTAKVKKQPDEENAAAAAEAVQSCPTEAIEEE